MHAATDQADVVYFTQRDSQYRFVQKLHDIFENHDKSQLWTMISAD